MNLLKENDAVMVDKDFQIDDECQRRNIRLVRPPFKQPNMSQFSSADCQKNRQIARARVHVERINERIKNFKILNSEISWDLLGYMDNVVTVVCGLVNLSRPILSDDRFD